MDGAWAEYALAFDSHVVTVPGAVSSLDAAPLTCAGVTTFKAVKVSSLQPGETAVVYGIGGLGHLALQYARSSAAASSPSTSRTRSWTSPGSSAPTTW